MQPTGTPCWIDLVTDIDRAKAFYGEVFGWTFASLGPSFDGWCLAEVDGHPVAGLGPGEPRAWQVFLRSDDLDATVTAAAEAGAEVVQAPGEVGTLGRAAVITDPGGANVALWERGAHDGFTMNGDPNTPVWFEVNTRESAAVRDFFAQLFGLEHKAMEGMEYYTLHAGDMPRYGVLQMTAEWDGMDPSWMAYFGTDDTDAAVERVKNAGGNVAYGPFDTPFGRIAVCTDPMGTAFSIIRPPDRG
jgi:predicted enzyme related to lactoylglutathione lyase